MYGLKPVAFNLPVVNQVSCYPRSENPDLHPTDMDPSAGTPDQGHPSVEARTITA